MTKRSNAEKTAVIIFFIIFVLYAVIMLFPVLWCVNNSFKSQRDFMFDTWGLPKDLTLENWKSVFDIKIDGTNILGMFLNSFILIIFCSFCSISSSAVTAYCLAKYDFKGKSVFYSVAVILMMIPSTGSTAAIYYLYSAIGLYDTYIGIIIMNMGGFGSGFLLLYGFFKNLPWSYSEAGFIDGASHFTIFFKIMLPMALPGIGAVAILTCIGIWNDYYTIYMYAPTKITVAYGLQRFVSRTYYNPNYPQLFSMMIVSMIPVIAIFCAFQKTILNNTAIGGLKG